MQVWLTRAVTQVTSVHVYGAVRAPDGAEPAVEAGLPGLPGQPEGLAHSTAALKTDG